MPYLTQPPKENPSAYFVTDRSNLEEIDRLDNQDTMLTNGMGGVLPEQPDPTTFRSILDVGCGTGGWLVEIAKTYPTIEKLRGGDINTKILEYARAKAVAEQLGDRMQFEPMDALRIIEFANGSFDLVNQRLGASWLRTWEWTKILLEYRRVCRPGGTIRITEGNIVIESNSPALTQLNALSLEAVFRSGRLFAPTGDGLLNQLERLMSQHCMEQIQTKTHKLVFRADTPEGQYFYEDMERFYRIALPFFRKWVHIPSDYHETYEQALIEMQQPDFCAMWTFLTIWGIRPDDGRNLLMRGLP